MSHSDLASQEHRRVVSQRAGRLGVGYVFALSGLVIGQWSARLADVKHHLGVSDGAWGTINIASACGVLIAMSAVRLVLYRVGARRLLAVMAPLGVLATIANGLA